MQRIASRAAPSLASKCQSISFSRIMCECVRTRAIELGLKKEKTPDASVAIAPFTADVAGDASIAPSILFSIVSYPSFSISQHSRVPSS